MCLFRRKFVAAAHPTLKRDVPKPVLDRRDSTSAVFLNVLLCDVAYWDGFPVAVDNVSSKNSFSFEDALGVVTEGPVPNVTEGLLRLI